MKIFADQRVSGDGFSGNAAELDEEYLKFLNTFGVSEHDLQRWIDRLPFSADAKHLLVQISRMTIQVGFTVITIGRKIIEIAIRLVKKFPYATAGLAIGALIGSLAGGIPIFGFLLEPIIMPLAMALGLARGAWQDVQNASLKSAIREEVAKFDKLKTA
ncbi:MAG: hypothetical protein OXE84_05150 [Rhodobacteraceae bacterium]|nr:hypothetical protein [Paracoccaceae bacterium]MCY4195979.1 hypothetical protein [Paracoccaceae bacterium]MCY4328002.1 hypothetical protein [Paracoccaceae bacterium]